MTVHLAGGRRKTEVFEGGEGGEEGRMSEMSEGRKEEREVGEG